MSFTWADPIDDLRHLWSFSGLFLFLSAVKYCDESYVTVTSPFGRFSSQKDEAHLLLAFLPSPIPPFPLTQRLLDQEY
jgi:hypothetical protein